MRRRNEDLDLVSAVAGTAGALEVAGRYLLGGVRTVRRRVRRTVKHARHISRSDATRAGRRAVTAVQVLRGTIPEHRVRPVSMLGAATAGVVFGIVTAFGIRAVTRVLVSGGPVVKPVPEQRVRVTA
jgi:hypothetical protein